MIKKLIMATNNANKLREVQEILSPLGIEVISQRDAGADAEPEENGITFQYLDYVNQSVAALESNTEDKRETKE